MQYDVIIIGAGAAGLMCAITAAQRGRTVLVLDHANKAGKKILMSGGGRCNFTNIHTSPEQYISHNPQFCKSALSRYTPWHFLELVNRHQIPYHEKTLGQLFCDDKAKAILNMLLDECAQYGAIIQLNTTIEAIQKNDPHYKLKTNHGTYKCQSLVIASGGLSIPTAGATPFGYQVADQFGLKVWPTRAGLVPFTLHTAEKERLTPLSGIAVDCQVSSQQKSFKEAMLFTHRGLSGPAMLQISSYWQPGEALSIQLRPDINLLEILIDAKKKTPNKILKTILQTYFPKRLVQIWLGENLEKPLQTFSTAALEKIAQQFQAWSLKPNNTEGYRTAEVTLGGVDCNVISSKTFECREVKGLFFIGEVLDITGWLGGYNFQWAWASGHAAGTYV
jgi:predicted Rossmann fold flavoprotein